MADPIQIAMQSIYFKIPRTLLQIAFKPYERGITIDQCIREDILLNTIMSDINIRGGKKVNIVLRNSYAELCPPPVIYSMYSAGSYSIYRIPPEDREGRKIASVISLKYPFTSAGYAISPFPINNINPGSTMGALSSKVLNSHTYANIPVTPIPILIQGDMVKIDPPQITHIDWLLECRLEWDLNFTSMDNSTINALSNLIYIATRAYIYTNCIIDVDKSFIYGGQELNIIKELIAEGKDYHERYEEALKKFLGATLLGREEMMEIMSYML